MFDRGSLQPQTVSDYLLYGVGAVVVWFGLTHHFPSLAKYWPSSHPVGGLPQMAETTGPWVKGIAVGATGGLAVATLASALKPNEINIVGEGSNSSLPNSVPVPGSKKKGGSTVLVVMGVIALVLVLIVVIVAFVIYARSGKPQGPHNRRIVKKLPHGRHIFQNGAANRRRVGVRGRVRRNSLEAAQRIFGVP